MGEKQVSAMWAYSFQKKSRLAGEEQYDEDSERRGTRAASKLRLAAELVESTAFDEAGEQSAAVISQLIMVAAELERLAQIIERSDRQN